MFQDFFLIFSFWKLLLSCILDSNEIYSFIVFFLEIKTRFVIFSDNYFSVSQVSEISRKFLAFPITEEHLVILSNIVEIGGKFEFSENHIFTFFCSSSSLTRSAPPLLFFISSSSLLTKSAVLLVVCH